MSKGLELTWLPDGEEVLIARCTRQDTAGIAVGRISKQGGIWAWQYTPPSGAWKGGPAGTMMEARLIIAEAHRAEVLPAAGGVMLQATADASKAAL